MHNRAALATRHHPSNQRIRDRHDAPTNPDAEPLDHERPVARRTPAAGWSVGAGQADQQHAAVADLVAESAGISGTATIPASPVTEKVMPPALRGRAAC